MSISTRIKTLFNLQDTSPLTKLEKEHHYYPHGESSHEKTELPRAALGSIVTKEPMIRKGIWKENKDIFGEGWEIRCINPEQEPDDNDLDIIKNFDRKANTKYKMEQAGISANIYGDGFIEYIFEEPEDVKLSDDIPMSSPVDLNILKAEYIASCEKDERKKDNTEYYVFKKNKKQYIHPNRVYHLVKKRLPGHLFGISDVETCSRILQSMMNADVYFGEFIEWAGKGVFDVTLDGVNETQLNEAAKKLKRNNLQIHDETAHWQVLNPAIMSPKEFYDYFFIKVAATLDMPQHILTGVQPGQLTGSEIGLADYYKNIINLQELVFAPALTKIYSLVLKGQGRSFENYKIEWNPIYIDEQSEAQILQARTNSAVMALDRFIITNEEARTIMKEGIQNLEGNIVLNNDEQNKDVDIPSEETITETKSNTIISDVLSLKALREKRLGELELELQEKRLKDAVREK